MPDDIDSRKAFHAAHAEMVRLLDAGDARAAIAFAEALGPAPGHKPYVEQIRAAAYTEGGSKLERRDLVEKGADLWRQLKPSESATIAYNLANAENAIWELAVRKDDFASAWQNERHHLYAARETYERVGADESARPELRAQALTNAGNSYDNVGRELDALVRYERAIALDPGFGMAHGNRGVTLLRVAPFMGEHAGGVLRQAAAALDVALENRDGLLRYGGTSAVEHFEARRATLKSSTTETSGDGGEHQRLADSYLDWCLQHRLFLHVSHECIREGTESLDVVFFRGLTSGLTDADEARANDLIDAFNAVKQDYMATRYLVWLATEPSSPIREHAKAVSKRALFLDTLTYSRFGVRTGIATQALAAAVDVLDKIASFVHLYLATGRVRDVYFSSIALAKRGSQSLEPQLGAALSRPERNRGLLALCDLSSDLGMDTALSRQARHRHTATHRFLVAHSIMTPGSTEWLDRLDWTQLVDESLQQLGIARAAIVYLARAIDIHEKAQRSATPGDGLTMPYEVPHVDTDLAEYE